MRPYPDAEASVFFPLSHDSQSAALEEGVCDNKNIDSTEIPAGRWHVV
jgi:hypothetical protein